MGLQETIQRAVKSGLTALDNLQQTVSYRAASAPSYDPTTGAPSVSRTGSTVKAMFVRYRKDEIDGDAIRPEDQKVLIGALGLGLTPTLNDTIVRDSETWLVQGAQLDPAGALWVIQVRRP